MSTSTSLSGFAVVTGAASGIGQATAVALAVAGITGIALLDINKSGLQKTESLILEYCSKRTTPPTIVLRACDVASPEEIEDTYNAVHRQFGRIDYAINCAGIVRFAGSVDLSITDFDLQNTINYRGLWLCQRSAVRLMRDQTLNHEAYPELNIPSYRAQRGAIVNISSAVVERTLRQGPAYAAAKSAILSLTKTDAADYADDRIRINAVMPGTIETPIMTPEVHELLAKHVIPTTPAKRWGQAEEVADVIVFLCSTGASFVTGSGWCVDGGYAC